MTAPRARLGKVKMPKVRRRWLINPVTRVKDSVRKYSRPSTKRQLKSNINE